MQRVSLSKTTSIATGQTVRRLAGVLFVVVASLALATINRPPGAYRSAGAMLPPLLDGAAAGVLILVGGALVARAIPLGRCRDRRSVSFTTGSCAALALGVATVAVAVAIFTTEMRSNATKRPTDAALKLAFVHWQADIVPLALTYGSAIRSMLPATRSGLARSERLRRRLARDVSKLDELARTVATDAGRYRRFRQLYALTPVFEQAIQLGSSAAADLAASLLARPSSGETTSAVRGGRTLLRRANTKLRHSQLAMQRFTFEANGLGGRLTAEG